MVAVSLFAGVSVTDFELARAWYARLLGRDADVVSVMSLGTVGLDVPSAGAASGVYSGAFEITHAGIGFYGDPPVAISATSAR